LKEAAKAMDAALEAAGLRILGGQTLFRLAACTSARQLFSHLASQGILTWPFQDRNALRFGLPRDEEELSRIRQALQSWCAISAD
jgi:cobalamin biosynthetic protein CobC